MMEGPWCRVRREARARERHRTGAVVSLKVLDPDGRLEKAIVALARRLAVIMHRMWVDGTEFRWTRDVAAA